MSYRTYILEKELAEVKAERDALALRVSQLESTVDSMWEEKHHEDRCEEAERKQLEYEKHIQEEKDEEYDLWCRWDEGQISDEEYYHNVAKYTT